MEELYVSHWEKVKKFFPLMQPVLRFLGEAQSLCARVRVLIDRVILLIASNLPMAQRLIQWLYVTNDEDLVVKGVADHKQFMRRVNIFINHHKAAMKVLTILNSLMILVPDIN